MSPQVPMDSYAYTDSNQVNPGNRAEHVNLRQCQSMNDLFFIILLIDLSASIRAHLGTHQCASPSAQRV